MAENWIESIVQAASARRIGEQIEPNVWRDAVAAELQKKWPDLIKLIMHAVEGFNSCLPTGVRGVWGAVHEDTGTVNLSADEKRLSVAPALAPPSLVIRREASEPKSLRIDGTPAMGLSLNGKPLVSEDSVKTILEGFFGDVVKAGR